MQKLSAALCAALAISTLQAADLKPNEHSFIDPNAGGVVINGYQYDLDTTSGATVQPSRVAGKQAKPMDLEEKAKIMHWTAEPPMGLIVGEYYGLDHRFAHFNDHYNALVDLVVDNGRIVHIEMDEKLSDTYYNKTWANQKKRRTGYTFFQFSKPRTDVTKVTWANGVTFLEYQILKHQSLDLQFDTVYGSSNSARDGFIPAVAVLKDMVAKPSGEYYIGYSKRLDDGLIARLQLVYKGKNIVKASYDEIFSDFKENVKDPALREFIRQSKYDSVPYNEKYGPAFKTFADELSKAIIAANSLKVKAFDAPEFKNFRMLADDVQPAVDQYLKNGYKHNIGKINQRPEGLKDDPNKMSRQKDIAMKLLSSSYEAGKQTARLKVEVSNLSDKPYRMKTESFYMYVMNTKNLWDTVADTNHRELTVPAKGKVVVDLVMKPIFDTDRDLQLKYDGRNKVYHSMNVKK